MVRNQILITSIATALFGSADVALADVSVRQDTLGPDGQIFGGSLSPRGEHVAVIAAKGSHYQILVDGAAGPKVDDLVVNAAGSVFRLNNMWGNTPLPVLFSADGAHYVYMAKQSDNYVVILDGQELARAPINQRNMADCLNLTISTNCQHVFWSDTDAQGNYLIYADGKPGPAMRNLSQLILSPDGNHYAYVNYNRDGTGAWAVVDGRQVNYFGDNLQYTPRNVLMSTLRSQDGNNVLLLNGKPEIKASAFNQTWISSDGKQIAQLITPRQGAQTFLAVNGKMAPGTQGLVVERVYFSRDGNHYAALCDTKTGARFMVIDGKKGDEYPGISQQISSMNATHWQYVTWKENLNDFTDEEPPVPGFTADSSKFVYVASSNGRQFLVVNDDESDPYADMLYPTLSPVGNRIGALATTADHARHVLMDGKDAAYPGNMSVSQLTFSPQGTRYAFIQQGGKLYVDGVAQPGYLLGNYVFSPDDKHIAYDTSGDSAGVVVDGKLICNKPGMINHIFFSPDSRHIYWVCNENVAYVLGIQTKDSYELFVDGKPALHYTDNGVMGANDGWATLHPEFSADDTMTFLARTDGNLRRFHVKSDTDLDALLAAAQPAKSN